MRSGLQQHEQDDHDMRDQDIQEERVDDLDALQRIFNELRDWYVAQVDFSRAAGDAQKLTVRTQTEVERALFRLYLRLSQSAQSAKDVDAWLRTVHGYRRDHSHRHALLSVSKAGDELWRRIDEARDLSPRKAFEIASEAKRQARTTLAELTEADILLALRQFDACQDTRLVRRRHAAEKPVMVQQKLERAWLRMKRQLPKCIVEDPKPQQVAAPPKSVGKLGPREELVWQWLKSVPAATVVVRDRSDILLPAGRRTGKEITAAMRALHGDGEWHTHLADVRQKGYVTKWPKRMCSVSLRAAHEWEAVTTPGTAPRPPENKAAKDASTATLRSGPGAWYDIHRRVLAWAEPYLVGMSSGDRRIMIAELEAEFVAFQRGLQTKLAGRARALVPDMGQVNAACRTLGLDPSERPIDMKKALRTKRGLARMYHPDMLSGAARKRGMLQRVLDAYEVLATYTRGEGRA